MFKFILKDSGAGTRKRTTTLALVSLFFLVQTVIQAMAAFYSQANVGWRGQAGHSICWIKEAEHAKTAVDLVNRLSWCWCGTVRRCGGEEASAVSCAREGTQGEAA